MATNHKIYDLIGIGIGPFNLSLAALTDTVPEMNALFFEQNKEFEWHPGMLLEGTDLQSPFIADLVTFADPTSQHTFLNYLHKHHRLYQFYFFNRFEIPRREYNDYCQWVASNLKHCHFGHQVVDIIDHDTVDEPHYEVMVLNKETDKEEHYFSRHLVLGTGSVPLIPEGMQGHSQKDILHTSQYLYREENVKKASSVTVVGSGQSASEVFYDLLFDQRKHGYHLTWFTRSPGFFQKEAAKLGREIFSPEYVEYFHRQSFDERMHALDELDQLRNGVDPETLKKIYHLLYHRSIDEELAVTIQPQTEVNKIERSNKGYKLICRESREDQSFTYESDKVILATGYKPFIPEWLDRFRDKIEWEDENRFKVTKDYRIVFKQERPYHLYTLTNIEHSHGASATNLGLSVLRNQTIINSVAGREVYPTPKKTVFQQFPIVK
ncbi:lysine N(6)-hydroxylase/L-ornithine N(5)-oxygenase family protein [Fictibacillus gelatini]|uniref:lysine N(6)-hydroxylase/L-ornithine N(5)-oxygenase family protein n=1 Tax=Fictibacillus gelatini TaxID=225985 RepID=UPI0004155465|nr:SidA/IucD/PvdA family monooxygenase [Fictibacillus gelatini]